MQVVGQPLQTYRLAFVQPRVAARVVAHEDFAERGVNRLNVPSELFAELKSELFLPASLCGARGHVPLTSGRMQDVCAESLVRKNGSVVCWRSAGDCRLETVVDDVLCGRDLRLLSRAQHAAPPE